MKYELGKTYKACVEDTDVFCSIHFKFFNHGCVLIKDVYDGDWSSYVLIPSVEVHHDTPDGTWILRAHVGCQPDWLFKREGHIYTPAIYEVKKQEVKRKHHDAIIKDNMVDAALYALHEELGTHSNAVGVEKLTFDKIQRAWNAINKDNMHRALKEMYQYGRWKNITKGGNNMKALYHVILFNRKTETIDYKEYVPAEDETIAGMTAAHDYDKYDGKVHRCIVKLIEGSEYEVIK